ncbi:hypothetical protein [Methylobacterium sp. 77]|uniref:hypothetical protein n=1 Tax=Methylobacterium sp. 77 TaxID=1101192 RepID=UPI000360B7F3|nr:hypothetical protein [Methylobacterium sp. 77]
MTEPCGTWADQTETTAPNGVAKRSLHGEGASLVRVVIPGGTMAGRHSHSHEQFVQVLKGPASSRRKRRP